MKITNNIIHKLNESEDSKYIIKLINDLILDEQEAIKGYNDAIDKLAYELEDNLYEKANNVLTHIKEEEEEHIRELKELLPKLLV